MREDWIECIFEDIVHYSKGKKPKNLFKESRDSRLPYINIKAFEKNIIDEYSDDDNVNFCKNGNILMVWDGARAGFSGKSINGIVGSTLMKILPVKYLDNNFLFYYLQSLYKYLNTNTKGVGIPHVEPNLLWKRRIGLPPLPEQRAIVKKIEALFSSLDAGISDLKKAQEQLKIYRQAVLKKAFEGELTKEWREQQTDLPSAEELKKEIKERLIDYGIKTKFTAIESSNYNLPVQWISVRNESLLFYVTSGSRDWKKYYADKGSIFVRTQNINKNFLDLTDVAYVDLPTKVEGKRSLIEKNNLLMTITGANVGKTAVIDKEIPEAYVSQSVALLKYFPSIFTKMYSYFFQSESHGKKAIGNLVYGVGRPVLSLENMREVEVLYCSYKEQCQIVKEIEARLSVCDAVEKQIQDSLDQAEAMRQSILKKAFDGRLLSEEELNLCKQAQDYEPASVLLEKIKAEKEASIKIKKNIKGKPPKKMEKKEILQLLAENNKEMIVDQLWKNSIYSEDIDAFYLKLKELAEQGKILEIRDGKKVSIKLI